MKTQFKDVLQFVGEIERLERLNADFVVPQGKMRMANDGTTILFGDKSYSMLPIAHEQVAAKAGIPSTYYNKIQSIPGLRAFNVNAWLDADKTAKRLVRTREGNARAILSDRFKPMDSILVVGAALPVIAANPELQVRNAVITDERVYLQVSFPKIAGEIRVGDIVEFGFTLTTSEVGRGKVDIQKWYHQLRCTNGYIGESVFSKRHVGRRIGEDEEDYTIFSNETIEAEMESLRLRLRDIITATISQEAFEADLKKFRKADGDTFLPSDASDVIENVTKHFGFLEGEMKSVLDRIMAENHMSRMGIADAITYQAHEIENQDHAYDLERAGFDLIAMSSKEWSEVIAA